VVETVWRNFFCIFKIFKKEFENIDNFCSRWQITDKPKKLCELFLQLCFCDLVSTACKLPKIYVLHIHVKRNRSQYNTALCALFLRLETVL